jgi:hypothetical protein
MAAARRSVVGFSFIDLMAGQAVNQNTFWMICGSLQIIESGSKVIA